jgi:microcystin-dependent protein
MNSPLVYQQPDSSTGQTTPTDSQMHTHLMKMPSQPTAQPHLKASLKRPQQLALALLLMLTLGPRAAHAQGVLRPPERMSYQGFLTDGNGTALATNAPKNYDVIFRIWNDQNTGTRLYTEQQTVTVDKGYFSVLLGEGSVVSGEPHDPLSSLFATADASERYVEFTVKNIGSGGSDVTILPRLKLLSSPYAFLASKALSANSVDGTAVTTGTVPDARLSPNVALRSGGNTFSGNQIFGSGDLFMDNSRTVSARNASGAFELFLWPRWSDNATYLNFGTGGFNIRNNASSSKVFITDAGNVGVGTTAPTERLTVAGNIKATGTLSGSLDGANLNNGSVDVTKLVAAVQQALCPPGTILPYGGDTAPAGWFICDGTFGVSPASYPALFAVIGYRFGGFTSGGVHWFVLPDLRGRFLRGRDAGTGRDPDRGSRAAMYSEGATGDAVGSVQNDDFRSHTHLWLGSDGNNSPANVDFTANEFGSKNQYQNTLATGGNETRPINVNVNYIIKY